VYHVDENASQNDDWHPMVMVEQADGLWDLQLGVNSGDAGDPFPGITANSALNAFTAPSTLSYDEQDTQVAVGDIRDPYISDLVDLTVQTLFEGDDPWISYLGSWYDLGVGSAGHLR
ncbi:MAG: hypothetical protein GTN93_33145, partial [Anaerolineae bacterium]|nr:hypothetical protein [Anaerolineae bacterium]